MRLPNTAHVSRPWRIHELTRDFRLEDVWALPGTGGADDFPRLVQGIASGDPSHSSSRAVRTLFAIRWKLGELLGWDGPDAGLGSRVPTLRDRLPADLRDAPSGPDFDALPFTSLYLLGDEWAAEIANRTMHGVMHIGWVPDGTGDYRGQMAVLVKPNGLLGTFYMAAIRPFRHLIVYPPMLRETERGVARLGECTPARAERRGLMPNPGSGKRRDFLHRILGSRSARRERPADSRRIPRHPRRCRPQALSVWNGRAGSMKVLVAGASGTLGRPLVAALRAAGHEVSAATRTPAKAAALEATGARPVMVDALDAEALTRAVEEAAPEAIVHLLTALPRRGPTRFRELRATNRLRIEGTRNLIAAARAAGAHRLVAESAVFACGFGDHGDVTLDESIAPVPEQLGRAANEAQQACLLLESQLLEASRESALEGVVLRLGFLYGPGVPSAEFMLAMLRRRMMALPGGGQAVVPWIEIGDAVAAFAAALERGPGGEIYNIVDDQPVTIAEFLAELARVSSPLRPYRIPHWLARLAMPAGAQLLGRTTLRASNAKAKHLLGWTPEHRSYRTGLRHWHQQLIRTTQ